MSAVAAILAGSLACFAQQAPADLSEASLEQLGQIRVYSASRHLQLATDAPSSVTIVTADDIQRYGYRTLADILNTVRDFYVLYDRNYTYVGVQGFARPGDFNTRILLMVDGHRLNDNVFDEAMLGTEFPLDIDLIDRVEIVRGPVSSLYGSNALLAVINVITKKGRDFDGFEVAGSASSFNSYKGRVSYGTKNNDLEFLVSGTFYGSRGHNQLFFPEYNSPQTNYGIASHADDDQLGSAFATISYKDFTLQGLYGTREKGIPTGAYGTMFDVSGTRTTDSHDYIDLRYHREFTNWEVLAQAFYDRYFYQGTYIYSSQDGGKNLDFADGKWWGTELQLSRTILSRNHVTVGGELRDNIRQDQTSYNVQPFQLLLNDHRNSIVGAGYVQDELTLTHNLALNAGYRYDYYSYVAGSGSPRAALIYRPWTQTALKFIYAQSFRVPNVYELYYSIPPNVSNPTLRPELMQTYQAAWEQGIGHLAWFTILGFHNQMRDLITAEPVDGGSLMFMNLRQARANGVELELRGQASWGLEGTASYSFQETKDGATNEILSNSPRNLFKLNLSQPLLGRRLYASADAQYTSAMQGFAGTRIPPFALVNFTILAGNLGRHFDLSASIYNLFDRTYYDPPSDATALDAIRQDGRSFRVKLTWHQSERAH